MVVCHRFAKEQVVPASDKPTRRRLAHRVGVTPGSPKLRFGVRHHWNNKLVHPQHGLLHLRETEFRPSSGHVFVLLRAVQKHCYREATASRTRG